jgi:hypothetical protein
LANPITDPLGTIIQGLLSSFTPEFLAFALIIGYFIFFLYFYGTKHWESLDWSERFFFGFLLGIFSIAVLTTAVFPLFILLYTLRLDSVIGINQLFYIVPFFFLIFLTLSRVELEKPLCSEQGKDYFYDRLLNYRSYWPYVLMLSTGIGFFVFIRGNPSLSSTSVAFWGSLVFSLDFGVSFSYLVMAFFVVQLSSLSSQIDPFKIIGRLLNWQFLSFYKPKNKICVLKIIEEEQKHASSPKKKRRLPRLNYDFLQWMTLVIIVVMLIGVSDSAFGIFTPRVQAIDTRYVADEIDFFRFENGSVMYTVQLEKTYWISLPIIPVRDLNLSIPNPSNLSNVDTNDLVSSVSQPGLSIASDNALSCSPEKDSDGNTMYVDLMALNSSLQMRESPCVKLTYANVLDIHLIDVSDPNETRLDNGSILVSMSLFINNTQSWELFSQQFPLFPVQGYGNMTSFSFLENGIEQQQLQPNPIWNDWLWSPILLISPHKTMNISVSATFEGSN